MDHKEEGPGWGEQGEMSGILSYEEALRGLLLQI